MQQNFPIKTGETASLFLQHFIKHLKAGPRPAKNVVALYNKRGTCEQWIKEGKGAIRWTRLSCRSFAAMLVMMKPTRG